MAKRKNIYLSDSVYLDLNNQKICFTLNGQTKAERVSPQMYNVLVNLTQSREIHVNKAYLTDDLYIDFGEHAVCRRVGDTVASEKLKPKMYAVLAYLYENHGVHSHETIMDNAWDYSGRVGDLQQVRAAIRRLDPDVDAAKILETCHGGGYKLNTAVRYDSYTPEQMLDMYIKALKWDDLRRYDESFAIYSELASQKHAPSVNAIGVAYSKGEGVQKDEQKGFEYYCRAADMGYSAAQLNAGDCYMQGRGTPTDAEKAVTYYILAATNPADPDEDAMFRLYECYRDGVGVEKNVTEAAYWRTLAQSNGRVEHRDYYDEPQE